MKKSDCHVAEFTPANDGALRNGSISYFFRIRTISPYLHTMIFREAFELQANGMHWLGTDILKVMG